MAFFLYYTTAFHWMQSFFDSCLCKYCRSRDTKVGIVHTGDRPVPTLRTKTKWMLPVKIREASMMKND